MEKKELPKEEFSIAPKISGLSKISNRAFGVIKLILGILFLPFVYSVTVSFLNEFSVVDKTLGNYFWAGSRSFLLIYLFIWEPVKIYSKGQKLVEIIFKFFAPLVKVAPYLLPIYFIIIFFAYSILSLIIKSQASINYALFLLGFSLALHLVFSARSIRSKKGDFLKSNYIFGFSFIYLVNLAVLSFCLNILFDKFSFVNFSNQSCQIAKDIFSALFKQIFL